MRSFARSSELEFEFFLALELHMTVARLRAEMSAREFMQWQVWYGRKRQAEELASKRKGR